jgi:hypothetical protein
MGTGSFPGVKSGRGVTLIPHPLLVLWWRKSLAIPLLPLWAIRPVQSLSACTRVYFTFTLPYAMEMQCVLYEEVTEFSCITYRNSSLTTNKFPKTFYQFTTLGHSNIFILLLPEGWVGTLEQCDAKNKIVSRFYLIFPSRLLFSLFRVVVLLMTREWQSNFTWGAQNSYI